MTYRTIAVYVNESRHALERVNFAAQLAVDTDAYLVGVAATALTQSYYIHGMGGIAIESATVLNAYLDQLKERALTALASFDGVADKAGVRSAEKRVIEDEAGSALCLQARYSDLLVMSQNDPSEALPTQASNVAEFVVINSGRPVLLIPYAGKFDAAFERVLIAWDGSLQAARAVTGAIPLLRRAKLVQVAVFDPEIGPTAHGEEPGADIALYLARHGVTVEVTQQNTGQDIDIGNAIVSYSSDFGADLIVMGAYGHSRFRELLLGGATHTILNSMTVPVLMSH